MSEENNQVEPENMNQEAEEMTVLKERAKQLGLNVSNNIGIDTLRKRVNSALSPDGDYEDEPKKLVSSKKTPTLQKYLHDEAMKLVRVRVVCMNPAKKGLRGEIFTVGNQYLGVIKKFVPYGKGSANGYHVPNIIYQQMLDRKYQQISVDEEDDKINVNLGQMVAELSIEVLPPLTNKELEKLAADQRSRDSVD